MSGLDEKQWEEVQRGLFKIDSIIENVNSINSKMESTNKSVNGIQFELTALNVELFGKDRNNGLRQDVRKNTEDIRDLKTKTGKTISKWLPVLACGIMLLFSIYTWASNSIQKDIQIQQLQQQINPAPTP